MDSDFYSNIRDSILAAVYPAHETQFPGVPVVIDNSPFDRNNAPELWAELEIKFMDASQVGPSANPKTRQRGFVYLSVYSRDGTGNKAALQMLGWFSKTLGYLRSSPVQCERPAAVDEPRVKGWHIDSLKVPFFADSD